MPSQLTPEQQMQIAFMLQGNPAIPAPQGIEDVFGWIGDHWSSAKGRDDINTTYYHPTNQRPVPSDEYYRQIQANRARQMRQSVQRFGGDTPESRQAYRQDFFYRKPLGGTLGLPYSGRDAWTRKKFPIRPI